MGSFVILVYSKFIIMKNIYILLVGTLLIITSCVTPKVHNTLLAEHQTTKDNLVKRDKQIVKLEKEIEELQATVKIVKNKLNELQNDSLMNGMALNNLQDKYNDLSATYDLLASKNTRYIQKKAEETKELLEKLEKSQNALFSKEDELKNLSDSLSLKQEELENAKIELDTRSSRVLELERIINKKDSMLTSLRKRISKALTGLEGEGLSIQQRNGKVYVSLEEKLLFASGSYTVNSNGVSALNKLAKALATQEDLDILVEGHTDSIPLSGKGLVKDNWDLSVMRATSVVKVLTADLSLDPNQLTAAGKGEYMPIANNSNAEGRSMNRRIEIILSPNLDDLFNLLED